MSATVIAVTGIVVAIAAFVTSIWVAVTARRDLTLTAYANAIQGGILDLKRIFAEHPDIFYEQMAMNPIIGSMIPDYMREDIPTFLAFAGGMWRLSYVYSVMSRGKQVGLKDEECKGLQGEMELWLTGLPGFYDVYLTHTSQLEAHNPAFKTYLDKLYRSEDFQEQLKKRQMLLQTRKKSAGTSTGCRHPISLFLARRRNGRGSQGQGDPQSRLATSRGGGRVTRLGSCGRPGCGVRLPRPDPGRGR